MEIVAIQELCKTYGQREPKAHALRGLTLSIEQKSFTAIVGRSGSGKTTLLNAVGGLDKPTSGHVLVCGQDLYAMKESDRAKFRRRHIGYVFQFFNLLPELTAYENICLQAYLDGRQPDRTYLETVLDKLDLQDKRNNYPAELSGGEQQRVAVARALSCKPDILLADEPTGNLDSKSGDALMELLRFSHRFFEQTILLVTHNLEIARTAERIITLADGEIVSDVNGAGL